MENNRTMKIDTTDYGPEPYVLNIHRTTIMNPYFRKVVWTGKHLQLTQMSIKPGEDIGLEIHPNEDQFIRIEDGMAMIKMGETKDKLNYQSRANSEYAFLIPAGTWHNIINIGSKPLKLYSIYAPPHHAPGTIHKTKADAEE